jgi:hypothetical protein
MLIVYAIEKSKYLAAKYHGSDEKTNLQIYVGQLISQNT